MKPILFHNAKDAEHSFYVQEDFVPHFYDTLHFHPEYQATFIINARGTVYINDYAGRFKSGDIFFIGSSVPHVFRCDDEYYSSKAHPYAHAISIYFSYDSFGETFFSLPENKLLNSMLKASAHGIQIKPAEVPDALKAVMAIKRLKGGPRLVAFLALLNDMAKAGKQELSTAGALRIKIPKSGRINPVFKYITEHFNEDIKLEKAAEISCMSPSAFCRFFKQKTGRTFSKAVRDTRIDYACKLLQEGKFTIQQVAYNSGYNNLSNFNRQFFQVIKLTPSEYIKKYKFDALHYGF